MSDNSPLDWSCVVCGKKCRKLQCSKCKNANYCSVSCQRVHWNSGHKIECRAKAAGGKVNSMSPPQAAWSELQQTLFQMTPQEAHHNFQKAQDELERLKQEEEDRLQNRVETEKDPIVVSPPTDFLPGETDPSSTKENDTKENEAIFSWPLNGSGSEANTVAQNGERDWTYVVDEMPNISSYQVTLWPKKEDGNVVPDSDSFDLSMHCTSQGNTLVSLRLKDAIVFSAQFPGRLVAEQESTNFVRRQPDCLSLRLQSRDIVDSILGGGDRSSLEAVQSLSCRYCDQSLQGETQSIKKVLPLPKGYWDEITDYLICYNGQPAVDFSSASTYAQESLVLEDSAILVLHSKNVGNGVCVLAVEGYGEEPGDASKEEDDNVDSATFRGLRSWRESVGGATVCCSQCCAVLGFASLSNPETLRLLKHRLSSKCGSIQWNERHSCASFVANEIARYAESKAIYTFIVSVRSEGTTQSHPKCILLKVLSWDTRMAKSEDSKCVDEVDFLSFRRVVRVIYEVTSDQYSNVEHDPSDPMNWTWGGVDLCCFPDATRRVEMTRVSGDEQTERASLASVRLWLSQEEWNELHETLLQRSKRFSKAITDATILVKLGPQTQTRDDASVGLSTLPLV